MSKFAGKYAPQWGKECKKAMIDRDLSLDDVAQMTEFSKSYLSQIMNGRHVAPDETIVRICSTLGVDAHQMVI